jgi:hypothetical protein
MRAAFALVAGLGLALAACYKTPSPDCAFLCGADGACPSGYGCASDGVCKRTDLPDDHVCESDLRAPIDASPGQADAGVDAAPDIDASPPTCPAALAPDEEALVLSEVDVGDFVEVYNNTDTAIDLDEVAYELVAGLVHVPVADAQVGAGITVPPRSYAALGWPAEIVLLTDASGELLLYRDGTDLADPTRIMGFVCWGDPLASDSRKADAETAGAWSAAEPCPSALGMGSIQREIGTDGHEGADFDTTAAPTPSTCTP